MVLSPMRRGPTHAPEAMPGHDHRAVAIFPQAYEAHQPANFYGRGD